MPSDTLLDDLRRVVTNELPTRLPSTVAFIVGANPSKGARSPKLWNAAFRALKIDGEMFPLDVRHEHLAELLSLLESDSRVVGAAVAAPYKADFADLLRARLAPAAARCGSINLMSRNADGKSSDISKSESVAPFFGSNTDGIAAIESLREQRPGFASSNVLVLGCGGTGRAVIASLLNDVKPSRVSVAVRSDRHLSWLNGVGVHTVQSNLAGVNLSVFDVVVNCTTVGWGDQSDVSPLDDAQIAGLASGCMVFDVVYQPDPTVLLKRAKARGLGTLSGTRMNLLQAVIAFTTANHGADSTAVASAMKQAAS